MFLSRTILFMSLLVLSACGEQTDDRLDETDSTLSDSRPASDQLSHAQAIARKARVSDISYKLDIDLISLTDAYQGTVELQFQLSSNDLPLNLDFTGGDVTGLIANGQSLEADYNGFFISLPASALLVGTNQLEIAYNHPYDQDGTGLHRFVDPEDGNTYLYTYLWPYYANRLFPNFDQPNLKATYELEVRADSDWQVISSTMEDSVVTDGDASIWHFPQSEKFSSYIFSLHAGPYHIWEDQAGDVPIRLMARQSIASDVAVDEWMRYTKAGLAHYRDYFDIPYPFVKYDQVIVPDFLIGAMENVAAVTFSESYVDRGPSDRFRSQRRAGTIFHEMAHMWFGDLVTKNWWNGLWLNESFATLMSSIAVSEVTEFDDLWHDFYLSTNLTAIAADKAVSTHPIEVPVNSTNDFFNVFDAITYEKGASVLNQLSHYLGREEFRLGVSNYLKQHSWGNTELADFMGALSAQSNIDLTPWAQDWMYSAGVNKLEARYSCEEGVISSFSLLQSTSEEHPTLRDQRVQLGLFASVGGDDSAAIEPYAAIPVTVRGVETQVGDAIGLACPTLVHPNYQGWGFTEVSLDRRSMTTIVEEDALGRIDDPLLRSMIWTALFNAADNNSDQELAGDALADNPQIDNAVLLSTIINSMETEINDRIIRQTLAELVGNLNMLERLGTGFADELLDYGLSAENKLWELIEAGAQTSESQSTLNLRLSHYINLARNEIALENLAGLLSGEIQIPGLQVGQGTRWTIIRRLAARSFSAVDELLAAERLSDLSDAGRIAAISVEAATANQATKQTWVDRFFDAENPLPLSHQRAAMSAIFPTGQEELQLALLPQLAAAAGNMGAARDNYYLRSYGRSLFSGICSTEGLEILSAAIAEPEKIGPTLYRFMSENEQRAAACVARKNK